MVLELDIVPLSTINQLILIVNFFQLILPALAQPINPLGGSERQNQLKFNFLGVCFVTTIEQENERTRERVNE
jgi:hypothetical protein